MTIQELNQIYNDKFAQAGDTEQDFNNWLVIYLLDKINDKKTINIIKRHLKGLTKAVEKLEEREE